MKTAFIYYSLEGNMEYIVNKISDKNTVDNIKLIPSKEYPTGKISKFIWGGKSATFGEKPKLTNENIEIDQYDTLIIGTPIWAGTFTPPINTFLHDYKINGKKIILIATHAGGGAEKCFTKMKELLKENTILDTIDFKNPAKSQDNIQEEKLNKINQYLQED